MITVLLIVVGALVVAGLGFIIMSGRKRPRQDMSSEAKVENQMQTGAAEKKVRASGID